MIIHVLDKFDEVVGVLSNEAPFSCPFYEDLHTENIRSGVNTFEFSVPAKHKMADTLEVEGSVIFRDIDGKQQMFIIKDIQETSNENEYTKRVESEHIAISELLTDIIRPTHLKMSKLEPAINYILKDTIYELGECESNEEHEIVFDKYITVLEALYKIAEEFQVEMQFEVEFKNGKITKKIIHLKEQLGQVTNKLYTHSKDLVDVKRTENSESVITALIGVGKGDGEGEILTLNDYFPEHLPDGFYKKYEDDFIYSEDALQAYGKNGKHKFGIFTTDKADNKKELTELTIKELKARSVPYIQWELKVALLERLTGYSADAVRVGDTITAKDTTMKPTLMIQARILEMKRSYTNPEDDEIVLGDYKPIAINNYDIIKNIQDSLLANKEKWSNSLSKPEVEEVVEGKVEPIERDLDDVKEDLRDKEYKIIRQADKPKGDKFIEGQLWLDDAGVFYRWDGKQWEKLISTNAEEIGAVGKEEFNKKFKEYNDRMEQIKKDIADKVDSSKYNKKIDELISDIKNKVDSSSYNEKMDNLDNEIKSKVSSNEYSEQIKDLKSNISDKVDSFDYDKQISELKGTISEKLDSKDYDEEIDSIKSDIADKANADYVDGKLVLKADADSVYTKKETNSKLDDKADSSTTYTKTEVDDALDSKVSTEEFTTNIDGVVTDLENHETRISQNEDTIKSTVSSKQYNQDIKDIESDISDKADSTNVYTKDETDTKLGTKADTGSVEELETRIGDAETSIEQNDKEISLKADTKDVYTKEQVDSSLKDKADNEGVDKLETRVYDNEAELSVQADKIASKVGSEEYNKKVSSLESDISSNSSDVKSIDERLSSAETSIEETDKEISLKATAEDVYTKKEVDSSLSDKADSKDLEKVEEKVSNNEAELSVQADKIASKVSSEEYEQNTSDITDSIDKKADADKVYTKKETDSKLDDKADSKRVSQVETRLSNAETSIEETDKSISLKADAKEVYTKKEVNSSLDDKADNETVKEIEKQVEDNSAELIVQADKISSKVSGDDYDKKVSSLESDISDKADSSTVDNIEERVSNNETDIIQTKDDIALKADSEKVYTKEEVDSSLSDKADDKDVKNIEEKVSNNSAELKVQSDKISSKVGSEEYSKKVSDLESDISKKADNSDLKSVKKRVSDNETAIEQTDKAIALKADSEDVYTKTEVDDSLSDKADGKDVDALESSVENNTAELKVQSDKISSKVSSEKYNKKVSDLESDISSNSSDVSVIDERLTEAETSITETDKAISLKADSEDVYTKKQVDSSLSDKADSYDVKELEKTVESNSAELKVQSDKISSKVSGEEYSSKMSDIGKSLDKKADSSDVYDKEETDTKLNTKADNDTVKELETNVSDNKTAIEQNKDDISLKADSTNVYTKEQVDSSLSDKANDTDLKAVEKDVEDNSAELKVHSEEIYSKVSSNKFNEKVSDLSGDIGKKADSTDLKAVETRVKDNETAISQTKDTIALKADSEDVYTKKEINESEEKTDNRIDSLEEEVENNSAELKVQSDKISTKVSSEIYENKVSDLEKDISDNDEGVISLGERLSSAETSIEETADEISLKANSSDVYKKDEVDSSLKDKADVKALNGVKSMAEDNKSELKVQSDKISSKVSSSKFNESINKLEKDVANKAGKTEINSLETRVTDNESDISQTKKDIKLKVNSKDVYTKKETNTKLNGKADTSTVNKIDSRVKDNESFINLNKDSILSAVSETEMSKSLEKAIDDIDFGGENLLLNTTTWESPWDTSSNRTTGHKDAFGKHNALKINGKPTWTGYKVSELESPDMFSAGTYTFSMWAKMDKEKSVYFGHRNGKYAKKYGDITIGTEWKRISFTFTTKGFPTTGRLVYWHSNYGINMYVCYPKLEKGTKATDYSPSYEDIYSDMLDSVGGENLVPLVPDDWENGYIGVTTGKEYSRSTSIRMSVYVEIDPKKEYTLTSFQGGKAYIREYTKNKEYNKRSSISVNVGESETFTPHKDTKYFRIYFKADKKVKPEDIGVSLKVKLEEGNTSTKFTTSPDDYIMRISKAESSIEQNKDSIKSKVSESEYKTDMKNMSTKMSKAETSIEQNTKSIKSKVSETDFTGKEIISKVSQTASKYKIDAKNIELKGAVKVLSDVTGDLGSITAGNIKGVKIEGSTIIQQGDTGKIQLDKDGFITYDNKGKKRLAISTSSKIGMQNAPTEITFNPDDDKNHFYIYTATNQVASIGFRNPADSHRQLNINNLKGITTFSSGKFNFRGGDINVIGHSFTLSHPTRAKGYISTFGGDGREVMVLYGAQWGSEYSANLYLYGNSDSASPGYFRLFDGAGEAIRSDGEVITFYGGGLSGGRYLKAEGVYSRTYTSTSQQVRVTHNGYLGRSTSSRRYKLVEEPVKVDPYNILKIQPKTWYDKNAVEDYCKTIETGEDTEPQMIERIAGVIAEDVEDAGLGLYVTYNDKGQVDGISENMWNLLIPITNDHEDTIQEQAKTISDMVKRIQKLEDIINKMQGENNNE